MKLIAGNASAKYRLDISEAMLGAAKLKQAFEEITHIDWAKDYVDYSKLSPVGKRKMLRKMAQRIALRQITYEQAKLYHRFKGRI